MARPKIGDVVEIKTKKGLSYALYTHRHSRYGALLRIFDKQYDERPKDFGRVVEDRVQFSCFFPLGAAVRQKIVACVGNVVVPGALIPFPIFRDASVDYRTGKVAYWWLWDGEKAWQVDSLTPEQRHLPIKGIWNDTLLIERIEEGYKSETDHR